MPPNNDILVWMKLPNEATSQGISSIDNFAKMDKDGEELVFRQLSCHEGVEHTAVGQLNFGLV